MGKEDKKGTRNESESKTVRGYKLWNDEVQRQFKEKETKTLKSSSESKQTVMYYLIFASL